MTVAIILKVSLSGPGGTYPAGSTLTTTEQEAMRLVAAGIGYYATISTEVQQYENAASPHAAQREKRKKK